MDSRLLDVLVCPLCKSPLEYDKAAQELICHADKLAFPVRDGIPIMWTDQARALNDAPGGKSVPAAGGENAGTASGSSDSSAS